MDVAAFTVESGIENEGYAAGSQQVAEELHKVKEVDRKSWWGTDSAQCSRRYIRQ